MKTILRVDNDTIFELNEQYEEVNVCHFTDLNKFEDIALLWRTWAGKTKLVQEYIKSSDLSTIDKIIWITSIKNEPNFNPMVSWVLGKKLEVNYFDSQDIYSNIELQKKFIELIQSQVLMGNNTENKTIIIIDEYHSFYRVDAIKWIIQTMEELMSENNSNKNVQIITIEQGLKAYQV